VNPKVRARVRARSPRRVPYLERDQGVLDGVPRGHTRPLGPLELAALRVDRVEQRAPREVAHAAHPAGHQPLVRGRERAGGGAAGRDDGTRLGKVLVFLARACALEYVCTYLVPYGPASIMFYQMPEPLEDQASTCNQGTMLACIIC
jgi:hypothetical protein